MGYSHEEWTPLLIHEKMAGNRDALSHDEKDQSKSKKLKQNSPRTIVGMDGTPLFQASHGLMLVGGGGV